MTLTLINTPDTFELVRDQIATILATEIASQQALATAGGEDPDLWKIRIFSERAGAWEQLLNDQTDMSPICNIWFDRTDYTLNASNLISKQSGETVYNIDCFGAGVSADDPTGGYIAGDRVAALAAHRALRLIRNILMAAEYTYLGLRGTVFQRWPQAFLTFQPEIETPTSVNVHAVRFELRVDFAEVSQQVAAEILEYISVTVKQDPGGEVIAVADYDYS